LLMYSSTSILVFPISQDDGPTCLDNKSLCGVFCRQREAPQSFGSSLRTRLTCPSPQQSVSATAYARARR
jgi:hypothetical protein